MHTQVHGHDVIAMVRAAPQLFTRESLVRAVVAQFGEETRFCTCSAEGLTAGELVDFFTARQKFKLVGNGLVVNTSAACQH